MGGVAIITTRQVTVAVSAAMLRECALLITLKLCSSFGLLNMNQSRCTRQSPSRS